MVTSAPAAHLTPAAPVSTSSAHRPRTPLRLAARWLGHVALFVAWSMIAVMALVTWVPHVTHWRTDVIIGPSMEPTIPLYSVIADQPAPVASIRTGDIITFQRPDKPDMKVTHRVWKIVTNKDGSTGFVTKGDNNATHDPWTVNYANGTAYRVVHHWPYLGWFLRKAQEPIARVLLIVIPAVVLLVQFMLFLWGSGDEGENDDGELELVEEYLDPETTPLPGAAA